MSRSNRPNCVLKQAGPRISTVSYRRTLAQHRQRTSPSRKTRHLHNGKPGLAKPCIWCGRESHPRQPCTAKAATCNRCHKKGHFANMCRSSKSTNAIPKHDMGFLGLMTASSGSKWDVDMQVDGDPLSFKIDTGADETVISDRTCRQHFGDRKLMAPIRRLCGPDRKALKAVGTVQLPLAFWASSSSRV